MKLLYCFKKKFSFFLPRYQTYVGPEEEFKGRLESKIAEAETQAETDMEIDLDRLKDEIKTGAAPELQTVMDSKLAAVDTLYETEKTLLEKAYPTTIPGEAEKNSKKLADELNQLKSRYYGADGTGGLKGEMQKALDAAKANALTSVDTRIEAAKLKRQERKEKENAARASMMHEILMTQAPVETESEGTVAEQATAFLEKYERLVSGVSYELPVEVDTYNKLREARVWSDSLDIGQASQYTFSEKYNQPHIVTDGVRGVLQAIYTSQGPKAAKIAYEKFMQSIEQGNVTMEGAAQEFGLDGNTVNQENITWLDSGRTRGFVLGLIASADTVISDPSLREDYKEYVYTTLKNKQPVMAAIASQQSDYFEQVHLLMITTLKPPKDWLKEQSERGEMVQDRSAFIEGVVSKIQTPSEMGPEEVWRNKEKIRGFLQGVLATEPDPGRWNTLAHETITSMIPTPNVSPTVMNLAALDPQRVIGGREEVYGQAGEPMGEYNRAFLSGLIAGAESKYKDATVGIYDEATKTGRSENFVAAYRNMIAKRLGNNGDLLAEINAAIMEAGQGLNNTDEKRRETQHRLNVRIYSILGKIPSPDQYKAELDNAISGKETGSQPAEQKTVLTAPGATEIGTLTTASSPAKKKEGKEGRSSSATPAGSPGGERDKQKTPEVVTDQKTPAERWAAFSKIAPPLAERIAKAVAKNARAPGKIPGAVTEALEDKTGFGNERNEYLTPSGVAIVINKGEVTVTGYTEAAARQYGAPKKYARVDDTGAKKDENLNVHTKDSKVGSSRVAMKDVPQKSDEADNKPQKGKTALREPEFENL